MSFLAQQGALVFTLGECIKTTLLDAFGARRPVPLSDGLDTRPYKILDPRLVKVKERSIVVRRLASLLREFTCHHTPVLYLPPGRGDIPAFTPAS